MAKQSRKDRKLSKAEEKDRKLSKAEERRLAHFTEVREALIRDGYTENELTIGIVRANVYVLLMTVPVCLITGIPFLAINRGRIRMWDSPFAGWLIFVIALLVLIVVHELLHGLTWGIFAQDHFKSIEFGFMKEYLTPYCTCRVPLKMGEYIAGALMPLIILGIIPVIAAIFSGSFLLLAIGIVMILSAGGDILIVLKLLRFRSSANERLIFDHPTQAGSVVFER